MHTYLKESKFHPTSQVAKVIYILIIYYCLVGYAIYDLGFPRLLSYFGDVIMILLTIKFTTSKSEECSFTKPLRKVIFIIIVFFIISLFSYIYNFYSPFWYIWGLRNYFRFFLFFIACSIYLKPKDYDNIFNILYYVLIANVLVTSYQCFIQRLWTDAIGGFFGSVSGSNGWMNILLCVLTSYFYLLYVNKKCDLKKLLIIIVSSMYIAVISEIKVFFFEFAIILILVTIKNKISFKKIFLICIGILTLYYSSNILNSRQNYSYLDDEGNFFTLSSIIEYTSRDTGYNGTGDINRLTAFNDLYTKYLSYDTGQTVLGIGLGAADYSGNFDTLTSSFYNLHKDYHYQWFSHAFLFLELGVLGVISYLLIFIIIYKHTRDIKRIKSKNILYMDFVQIMIVLMLINFVYNIALRSDYSAYLLFMILSIPYSVYKNTNYLKGEQEYERKS